MIVSCFWTHSLTQAFLRNLGIGRVPLPPGRNLVSFENEGTKFRRNVGIRLHAGVIKGRRPTSEQHQA